MDSLNLTFAALADPTRRAILARLVEGETHVGELGRPFDISGPAVSRHLRVLERAGLIERKVNAQWRVCRLRAPGLRAAHDWLARYRQYWEESLDRLVDLLEQSKPAPPPQEPKRVMRRRGTPPTPTRTKRKSR
ncbi:MAG: helix-turn-helix transcriptional regulator [Burkholderiales bacterium]|jgi:DNA-binding transcriptional ArsR family regulator|nr:helix-turn-helix transcriptional regulator [Burkholderiales bacterium]